MYNMGLMTGYVFKLQKSTFYNDIMSNEDVRSWVCCIFPVKVHLQTVHLHSSLYTPLLSPYYEMFSLYSYYLHTPTGISVGLRLVR